ncbi:MAG: hypothetical protein K2Z81_19880 [Cyanobacteria bacterium]|nr:hypothetical protein [Cyanobacteriota bacterium]
MERWMDIQKLGQVLRWLGSLLLLGASASFMLEGWNAFDSQLRYWLFLAYVLGLAGLGILLGWRIREDKGARTLLGLAVVGIASQFSQLGAMIHSLVSVDNGTLPTALLYEAGGWAVVAGDVGALLLLVPVAYMGFAALHRPEARRLAIAYLLACCSLLIPVRHGLLLTGIMLGVIALVLWFDGRFMAGTPNGSTSEGITSRLLLLLPMGILIARTAFYPQSMLFLGVTALLVGLCAFEMAPKLVKEDAVGARIQTITLLPIVVGWCVLTIDYLSTVVLSPPPVLTWLPLSGLMFALSTRARTGATQYRKAAAVMAAAAWIGQLMTHATPVMSFLCLAFSIGMVLAGFYYRERLLVSTGVAGAVFALGYHVRFAFQLYDYSSWGLLAVMGIGILLTASYLEKRATWMFGRLVMLREEMKAWH